MEVFRHSRRRSKYHSLNREELIRKKKHSRSSRGKTSKRPRLYRDIDEQWRRSHDDEWYNRDTSTDVHGTNSTQKESHDNE